MGSFSADLWKSFNRVQGTLLSVLSLLLAIASFFYTPAAEIRFNWKWVFVGLPIYAAICATLIDMLIRARGHSRVRLPRTRHVVINEGRGSDAFTTIILVLEASELFGVNILVTIYYSENLGVGDGEIFERPIGVGRVINVQQNGLIQVLLIAEVPSHADLWQRIRRREVGALAQLVVKPSVFFDAAGIEVRVNE
jgi:hypothetical protein